MTSSREQGAARRWWHQFQSRKPRGRVEDVRVTVAALEAELRVLDHRHAAQAARHHILRLLDPGPRLSAREHAAAATGVRELLDVATRAAALEDPRIGWVRRFWTGRHLEAAYGALLQALVRMVDLYSERELVAATPQTLDITRRYLHKEEARRIAAEKMVTLHGSPLRAELKAARTSGYRARDLNHKQQRTFRNALIIATLVTCVFVGGLVATLHRNPEYISLCFESVRQEGVHEPATLANSSSVADDELPVVSGRRINCPTGGGPWQEPSPRDIVLVTFLGMIGAALAAAVTVRGLQVTTSPYDVPLAVSLFKIPLGALTAFIGLLAIKAGLVPGLSALDSPAQILAYAVLLGYAQQLATTFLDRRAANLGKADMPPQNGVDLYRSPVIPPPSPGPAPRRWLGLR
jgi:hypothetical protein